jgi:hypothetical protein
MTPARRGYNPRRVQCVRIGCWLTHSSHHRPKLGGAPHCQSADRVVFQSRLDPFEASNGGRRPDPDQFATHLVVRDLWHDDASADRVEVAEPGTASIRLGSIPRLARQTQRPGVEHDNPSHGSIHPFEERTMRPTLVDAAHDLSPDLLSVRFVEGRGVPFFEELSERLGARLPLFVAQRAKPTGRRIDSLGSR